MRTHLTGRTKLNELIWFMICVVKELDNKTLNHNKYDIYMIYNKLIV